MRTAEGNGPVDAFVQGLSRALNQPVKVLDYHEHAIGAGAQARAAAYLEVRIGDAGALFGVGIDANIVTASVLAVLCAVSRASRVDQGSPSASRETANT